MYRNKTNLCVYLAIWRILLAVSVAMMLASLAFDPEVALCTPCISRRESRSVF